jgi:hypothetical protein
MTSDVIDMNMTGRVCIRGYRTVEEREVGREMKPYLYTNDLQTPRLCPTLHRRFGSYSCDSFAIGRLESPVSFTEVLNLLCAISPPRSSRATMPLDSTAKAIFSLGRIFTKR